MEFYSGETRQSGRFSEGFLRRRSHLARWIAYYNTQRPHSGLAGRTPAAAYGRIGESDHGGMPP